MTRDKRDAEKRIEELREARLAEDLKRDDADGPPLGELTEKQEEQIAAVIEDARRENPEALVAAEKQLRREHESGELERAQAKRREQGPTPFNAGEKSTGSLSSDLTEGERALLDALSGGYDRGDDGDDRR